MIASTQTNNPLGGDAPPAEPPDAVAYARAKIKQAGLRVTQPRLAIVATLARCTEPVGAEELHRRIADGACDLVTVYRCMGVFEELGLVRRAYFKDGAASYELDLGAPPRYHVVCRATKRVEELDAAAAAEIRAVLVSVEDKLRARGFRDVRHVAEFFALAPR
ncbi:MAG: hypothetical protein RLZZ15_1088 [Verrucomicrobiota bacterium]